MNRATAIAREIAANAPRAVQASKRMMRSRNSRGGRRSRPARAGVAIIDRLG